MNGGAKERMEKRAHRWVAGEIRGGGSQTVEESGRRAVGGGGGGGGREGEL